jgi:tRNA threonylcarbamoyladenosine biosynthesis protein TsaE
VIAATTQSRSGTLDLGRKLAAKLAGGEVIVLTGQLGAGKTTLIQGIALGLGIEEVVASPSYILIAEYSGRMDLFHMDLYRLNGEQELLNLGIEEYLYGSGVSVIEWGEKILHLLPENHGTIKIEVTGPESRRFSFSGITL